MASPTARAAPLSRTSNDAIDAADRTIQGIRMAEVSASKDRERLEDERTRIAAELDEIGRRVAQMYAESAEAKERIDARIERGAGALRRVTHRRREVRSVRRHQGRFGSINGTLR